MAYNILSAGNEDNGLYTLFPGYKNLGSKGNIIDEARNDEDLDSVLQDLRKMSSKQ